MTTNQCVLFLEDSDLDFELAADAIHKKRPTLLVDRAKQCSEMPSRPCEVSQLVVLDVHLPDGSGLDLIPQLVKECGRHQGFTLVVFSTSTNPSDRQQALHAGAHRFFVKPQEPDQFVHLVQTMVDSYLPEKL